ncbi:hypothetical protein M407DRAFT_224737 [Tulasnella calospora MUT 4182]|uniref:Methyltransferase-domain-containing protein n=1 Tax=Tulasnella calospora MUT 4182 TaxID=1051891 RepID=A0A0C3QRG8_9AGAM|nr:hypothetical protein M407DRAFT_224737 [Tulasnella calospora MUT 4182]
MFFYLSFLRPPPRTVSANAKDILITPQIANDLRTETFEGQVDIWCCWILELQTGAVRQPSKKLTAWKGSSSSYKVIPIDLPSGRKAGQSWRLALWVPGRSSLSLPADVIDLCPDLGSANFGTCILPVTSSPILFEQGGKKEGPKQERIWRSYALPISPPINSVEMTSEQNDRALITIVEQTSFDLDKKIWDSGLGLSSWLAELCRTDSTLAQSQPMAQDLKALLLSPSGFTAVELGTGIGFVSLMLSAILEPFPGSETRRILATDLESAIPLIEENFAFNKPHYTASLSAATLDWEQDLEKCEALRDIGAIDLIMLADVTYNRDVFPALLRTLISLLQRGGGCTRVVMGYKQRDAAERTFWTASREMGVELVEVGRVGGVEDSAAVEIWMATRALS